MKKTVHRRSSYSLRSLRPLRTLRTLRPLLPVLLAGLGLLILLAGVSAAAPPEAVVYNPTVAAIISQVTTPTLVYELEGLTGERPVTVAGSLYTITTRNSYQTEAISMATRYAYEQFAEAGLAVTYHDYVWNDNHWRNVVAEKPGEMDPEKVYLIVAHVDDMPPGPLAPGADDNGSGSVAVLMAARLLAPHRFAHTIRFVLFTGEEQGLWGSAAYAAACADRGEDIQGVINLDMIGYNTGRPMFNIYARRGDEAGAPGSRQLADLFSDVTRVYDLDLVPLRMTINFYPLIGGSDQWSFLSRGYPAILVIEDYVSGDFNPYYHGTDDTIDILDLDYYADLTRASIAAVAHLGVPLPGGRLSGTVTDAGTGQPLTGATVAALAPTYRYTFTAMTGADGGYSLVLPAGSYTLTVWASSPGYRLATVSDVVVAADIAVTRDVALAHWERSLQLGDLDFIVELLIDSAHLLVLHVISGGSP